MLVYFFNGKIAHDNVESIKAYISKIRKMKAWMENLSQKLTITVVGREEEIKEFVDMLKEQKIGYYYYTTRKVSEEPVKEEKRPVLEVIPDKDEVYRIKYGTIMYRVAYRSMRLITLSDLLNEVTIKLTKKAIRAIIKWLRERRKKGLKKPKLKIIVEGNILDLSQKDMRVLMKMLEEVSKEKSSS